MARKPPTLRTIINELVDRTNTDTQRIRVLEQREEALTFRINAMEQEALNINKAIQKLASSLESELKKRDRGISELQVVIKEMIKQLKRLATSGKVKELEAMLDLYNPLKSSFMTRDEVEQLISKRLSGMPKNNK
jgi:vacuolar-type H+-ATPase subunit I/STV1